MEVETLRDTDCSLAQTSPDAASPVGWSYVHPLKLTYTHTKITERGNSNHFARPVNHKQRGASTGLSVPALCFGHFAIDILKVDFKAQGI